ncbi:HAD superfamily hydrolase (TIGR01509 family) [Methylobacterium sp. PvP062]|uniref:HAD-superfamily hydrolase, subfamily IA, variant 3 n=2 Tax=Methylobacterium radiotolerans TaxID=31998 RepID=B1LUU6_METRJ|nr:MULTISPECIES: HAD-IA family hydrolase [Methylobacterium]MCX7331024.1 HAD-IA family hydrolase [Hyphomicrobiales bacterium]GAN47532.1 HAD family hydrolase [Methylobacterium sp. ME121]ACB25532.1 HAD-superfamily hydrolase, subfamily IA, variant 3 [Methylobacterium radiotolerans JCM 2831]KIU31191.1 haloacid dehalogenase [Methylobacterium radiotolerans]KZB98349.1 Phosphorylated carbohydrates phosphatase [Methylobacterium radiotolerans]
MLRALIFDVDGTLAETEDLHRQAFNRAFAELGLPWRWDEALYADLLAVMGGKERLAHFIDSAHPADAEALHARAPEIHARKTRAYGDLVAQHGLPLRPGIARLIAEARAAGIRLAVATTTSRPNVDRLLAANFPPGAAPFDVIAAGDEASRKKPAPDVFLLALAGLGIPASEAVAFEDSAAGISSARSAGLPVLATRSRYTESHRLDGAFSAVSDLGEPERPHRHLAGVAWPGGVVDLAALIRWHEAPDGQSAPFEAMGTGR